MHRASILLALLALLFATPAQAQAPETFGAMADAQRIAADWKLGAVTLREVDGQDIESLPAPAIHIGKGFIDRLSKLREPKQRKAALTFILLHELWHTKQRLVAPARFADDELRPVTECQADLEAATAYARDRWSSGVVRADETVSASPRTMDFRATWDTLMVMTAAQEGAKDHLTASQRAVAMNLGLQRGIAEGLKAVPQLPAALQQAGRLLEPFADNGHSADSFAWSWEMCERIVGHDKSAVLDVRWNDTDMTEDGDGSAADSWVKFKLSAHNTSGRPIRASLTALAGTHPDGKEDEPEQHVLSGIATSTVDLQPGEKKMLEGRMRLNPDKPEAHEWFVWAAPPIDGALVSASYLGPAPVPPACSDRWVLTRDDPLQAQLADLAQLGAAAREGFQGLLGPVWATINDETIYHSRLNVAGAIETRLHPRRQGVIPPHAISKLYQGPSEAEASRIYRASLAALRRLCAAEVGDLKETTLPNGLVIFNVERLTPLSKASLRLYKREPGLKKAGPEYHVDWSVYRTGLQ
jgi:hypothetical protein